MTLSTKMNKVEKNLVNNNGFSLEGAKKAIKDTLEIINLENYSVGYFCRFINNTYGVDGVER